MLSELGLKFVATQIEQFGSRYGVEFRTLAVQESVEI
ncbi:metal-dependent hydrolase [Renibacterium salmoninarum ATCC 33209]|uniref:Metal-dependent hydrolase n=1 Tax=Renibacterium salmoninarum (strain ATCC 33209 / DSM 20767 / JCM 11484 / NBRC 15589 / NCIMB 2235) TaxID=288705 RepID=A9WPM6_RENSM|nr:metal-dependent hydrolase [Renibacterium salmoninarum ATCC 33209]